LNIFYSFKIFIEKLGTLMAIFLYLYCQSGATGFDNTVGWWNGV